MSQELIHGDLTYRIIGLMYKVHNTIGSGFQEKYYQRAIRQLFLKERVCFREQVRADFDLEGVNIGKYYLDFVVDNKLVIEIKAKAFFSKRDIKQILGYLKKTGIEVGLLIGFSGESLKIKRLLKGRQ